MKTFEQCIEEGAIKRKEKNPLLAASLVKSSDKALIFVEKLLINEETAEHIVGDCYDIMREIIEAKLAQEGYKSYSHEASISYLAKHSQFTIAELDFLDNLRKVRNGIKYYGKEATALEAQQVLDFLKNMLPKLKELLKNDK